MILSPLASLCLDILRILAAQTVLIGHLTSYHKVYRWLNPPYIPYIQNIAVLVFFIISGFLISLTVFLKKQNKTYSFRQYFLDRFARIYSGFLPCLLLVFFLDFILVKILSVDYRYSAAFNLKTFFTNLFMLQYFPSIPFGSGRPFWILPLWWWTYLSFGWIFLKNQFKSRHPWLSVVVFLSFFAIPLYSLFFGRGQGLILIWLLGSLIYFVLKRRILSWINPKFSFILFVVFLSLAGIRVNHTRVEYEILFGLFLSFALFFLLNGLQFYNNKVNPLLHRSIKLLAGYSFTLFLTHVSVNYFFVSVVYLKSPWLSFWLSFLICNLVALIFSSFTEAKASVVRRYLT